MTESPKVPGTVEDSHAKLAAEMREAVPDYLSKTAHPYNNADDLRKWAARVEQLGRDQKTAEAWKALYDGMYLDKCALQKQLEAVGRVEEKKAAFLEAARKACHAWYEDDTPRPHIWLYTNDVSLAYRALVEYEKESGT